VQVVIGFVADHRAEAYDGVVTSAFGKALGDDRQLERPGYPEDDVFSHLMTIDGGERTIEQARCDVFIETRGHNTEGESGAVQGRFGWHRAHIILPALSARLTRPCAPA